MVLAQAINATSTVQKHALGQRWKDEGTGKEYMYVKFGEITTAGQAVSIPPQTFTTALLVKAGADAQHPVGVAIIAAAANVYGWVQVYGISAVSALANCAHDVALYTCATGGSIDDTATDQTKIQGIVLLTTVGGSTAVTACFLNYPRA